MKTPIFHTWEPETFRPPVWLKNKHMQTILASLVNPKLEIPYRRERWDTPDNDFLDLDFIDGDPQKPVVLACHGLEGSSESQYIRRLMNRAKAENWNGIAINFRGCSGEENKQLRTYHSGETSDLHWVISKIRQQYQQSLFLCGYSLGGNVIAKWLGEQGQKAKNIVSGACVCCAPFDLFLCQQRLDQGFNKFVYVKSFLKTLKPKTQRKLMRYSDRKDLDLEKIMNARTFKEFDNYATAKMHGFSDYRDYYKQCSSRSFIKDIAIPTLLISAMDDPFIPSAALPGSLDINHETVKTYYATKGGHIGFIAEGLDFNWLTRQIFSWFESLLRKN